MCNRKFSSGPTEKKFYGAAIDLAGKCFAFKPIWFGIMHSKRTDQWQDFRKLGGNIKFARIGGRKIGRTVFNKVQYFSDTVFLVIHHGAPFPKILTEIIGREKAIGFPCF